MMDGDVVAREGAGEADETDLNSRIAAAWRRTIGTAEGRSDVASVLGVDAETLRPDAPPLAARISGSGAFGGGVEIVAAAFAAAFVKDMATAAGKDAAARLRRLWTEYMRGEVSPPGSGVLKPGKQDDGG